MYQEIKADALPAPRVVYFFYITSKVDKERLPTDLHGIIVLWISGQSPVYL